MLVLDGQAEEAAPSGPTRDALANGEPVEILLQDWQYTIRVPSRFH
ncbi:MAG: hypothetical protein KDA42_08970 [Planctomycetales bacterium]|nr:hypothetical protein [Planctomycetales bacterium]